VALGAKKQALVILSALALITVLYIKTDAVQHEYYIEIAEKLREIKHVEALIGQHVLKAGSGLVRHVDTLNTSVNRISALLRKTNRVISQHSGDDVRDIGEALDTIGSRFTRQAAIIEDFKSDNAVLRNSLAYLSISVAKISASIRSNDNNENPADEIDGLRFSLLDYFVSGNPVLRHDADKRIRGLKKIARSLQSTNPPNQGPAKKTMQRQAIEINQILSHANILFSNKNIVKTQVKTILLMS
jgi:two-component system NtrC family sensor kinase